MRRILILSAGFGNGHNAAAYHLREALELSSEEVHVEVLDLFKLCYGKRNDWTKRIFLWGVEHLPSIWGAIYWVIDKTSLMRRLMMRFRKVQEALAEILRTTEPEVVVSTYPAYNHLIDRIYEGHRNRTFKSITIVTDSLSINSVWYQARSDYFLVPNEPSAKVLIQAGVDSEKVHAFGFPVSPRFVRLQSPFHSEQGIQGERRVLYIINHGRKKIGQLLERIAEMPGMRLTITCGNDPGLMEKLVKRFEPFGARVTVLGWTQRMPELLVSHHLVITKAGGAIVQEAIAAKCPLLINQVIPGQEAGNARLVEEMGVGCKCLSDQKLLSTLQDSLYSKSGLWGRWRKNMEDHSRPDVTMRIAAFVLGQADLLFEDPGNSIQPDPDSAPYRAGGSSVEGGSSPIAVNRRGFPIPMDFRKPLLCDFHTHSQFSDGMLTIPELVDFYGVRGFDCLCITDHLADKNSLIGRMVNLSNMTMPWTQMEEYFDTLEREKRRAWKKYGMCLMTGIEFNKDGITQRTSAHLLGIDLKHPINPDRSIKELIQSIHEQDGLAVASHPHLFESHWGKNTLHLWERQDEFAPLLDAWEIANRDDLFNPVGLRKLPFLANSDFHKPKHISSWKTLLYCEKHPDAIKQCIRENVGVSIMLYRDSALEKTSEWDRLSFLSTFRFQPRGRKSNGNCFQGEPLPASA